MKTSKIIVVIASIVLCSAGWSQSINKKTTSALDEIAGQNGLVRVKKKNVDLAYTRPGATLAKYNKVLLKPVDVSFAKNFDPGQNSVMYKMNPPERDRIKSELAEVFAEVFKKELEETGKYKVVTESGADVLEVRAAIINLYITAPDVSMQTAGRSKVYTSDAGEMTLALELRDSVTSAVLALVYDRRSGDTGVWQWTTSVSNTAEAQRIIASWSTSLRKALDASRAS